MIAVLVSSAVLLRNEMPAGRIPPASAPLLRGLHRFQGTVWGSLVFQFGERANYEAHFGSVGSRYLLYFYNVLYRVCPGAQQLSQTDQDKALQLLEFSGPLVGCGVYRAHRCGGGLHPGDDHRESDGRSGRPQPRRR